MDFVEFFKKTFGDRPLPDVWIITLVMYSVWFQLYFLIITIFKALRKAYSFSNNFFSEETLDISIPAMKEFLFFILVFSNMFWIKGGVFPIFSFMAFFRFLIYISNFIVEDIVSEKIKNLTFLIYFFTLVLAFMKLFANK